jgi:hypothetical protein
MSIVYIGKEYTIRQQRHSKDTSTNASIAQAPFVVQEPRLLEHKKPLPILRMVDDYNYSINGVDITD